ncbi:ubiquitin carboxyl-terminal hydrolase 47 [Oryzias melastigma]|uniref:ubiquitin carboxyl-terminal hydrolase 47 n=1 Tax=Oryzias melastigma TaxID=30732 RepID=UPI00168CB08F|nr:ubiquitin carboxyl-terminal hydrolase 47 [Oryzias melastigma]
MSSSKYQQNTGDPYKGIWNQGFTCYLNSVLQVLFMTPDFREALQRSPPGSLDSHLKELFDELKKQNGNTCNITKALRITDVHVQADAAECFENILRNITNPEASQIFQGVLRVKNKCSKCDTETCDDNPCWSLPLELVDSKAEYRVEDGITQYFCPSEVSGPDQLFCGNCKVKTDSTVKLELYQHPEVLMLLLKRFKFDYNYMHYYKVERRVELPLILEIQNQTYELYAFVEHHGYLKYGHYTANIKSHEDGKWYHFNDSRVNHCYQFFQLDTKESSHSAYLLFYRKTEDTLPPDISEASKPEAGDKQCFNQDVESRNNQEMRGTADEKNVAKSPKKSKRRKRPPARDNDIESSTHKVKKTETNSDHKQIVCDKNAEKEKPNQDLECKKTSRSPAEQMEQNKKGGEDQKRTKRKSTDHHSEGEVDQNMKQMTKKNPNDGGENLQLKETQVTDENEEKEKRREDDHKFKEER